MLQLVVDYTITIARYCEFGNFREGFILRSFEKIKSSRNGEIILSFTDAAKCYSRKFSRKFPDLQYILSRHINYNL